MSVEIPVDFCWQVGKWEGSGWGQNYRLPRYSREENVDGGGGDADVGDDGSDDKSLLGSFHVSSLC